MQARQFRYAADNFGYLIFGAKEALAIDGGAIDAISTFLKKHDLELKYVTNTHAHPDHTIGTQALTERTGAEFLNHRDFHDNAFIELEHQKIFIYHTPGHTDDSVSLHADRFLITGDTLFNATVGNCFSGDLKSFYHSIKRLMALANDSIVYAGHDYVKESLHFAKMIEPQNQAIDRFLACYDPKHVFSTLGDEHRINPYLRFNHPDIISFLRKRGLPVASEYERWQAIMSVE